MNWIIQTVLLMCFLCSLSACAGDKKVLTTAVIDFDNGAHADAIQKKKRRQEVREVIHALFVTQAGGDWSGQIDPDGIRVFEMDLNQDGTDELFVGFGCCDGSPASQTESEMSLQGFGLIKAGGFAVLQRVDGRLWPIYYYSGYAINLIYKPKAGHGMPEIRIAEMGYK